MQHAASLDRQQGKSAVEKRKETLVGTAIVLLGVPFYLYWKKQRNTGPRSPSASSTSNV